MAKILIVDDDEDARLLERRILESAGYELDFAKNGAGERRQTVFRKSAI
jgi:CheY-like chemotaxis protein